MGRMDKYISEDDQCVCGHSVVSHSISTQSPMWSIDGKCFAGRSFPDDEEYCPCLRFYNAGTWIEQLLEKIDGYCELQKV